MVPQVRTVLQAQWVPAACLVREDGLALPALQVLEAMTVSQALQGLRVLWVLLAVLAFLVLLVPRVKLAPPVLEVPKAPDRKSVV